MGKVLNGYFSSVFTAVKVVEGRESREVYCDCVLKRVHIIKRWCWPKIIERSSVIFGAGSLKAHNDG